MKNTACDTCNASKKCWNAHAKLYTSSFCTNEPASTRVFHFQQHYLSSQVSNQTDWYYVSVIQQNAPLQWCQTSLPPLRTKYLLKGSIITVKINVVLQFRVGVKSQFQVFSKIGTIQDFVKCACVAFVLDVLHSESNRCIIFQALSNQCMVYLGPPMLPFWICDASLCTSSGMARSPGYSNNCVDASIRSCFSCAKQSRHPEFRAKVRAGLDGFVI